ncbi:hypothetical protein G6F31_017991 [Rhizopus arrhizus]|nr:hypothetical protein G6F31_017991 [Rhizopus arrhizus]
MASPGEPLQAATPSMAQVDLLAHARLQVSYLNGQLGRKVAGGRRPKQTKVVRGFGMFIEGRVDVRFWPEADVPAPDNAIKNARVRSRTEADVRLLQTWATPEGPVVQLPGVLGSQ